ncbi:hypothetical protein PTTG_09683, partial [Puccinia triticina 1-1 BBBD Race 1]
MSHSTSSQDLPTLQRDLLAALRKNDTDGLIKFGSQYSQVVLQLEEAIPANSLSADELQAHLCLSHNVYIASTLAQKVQLTMDEMSDKFSRQLSLLPPMPANVQVAPSPPPPKEPTVEATEATSDTSTSHTILKNWSQ